MKKIILIVSIFSLTICLNFAVAAETTINQKVIRQNIKIVPKETEKQPDLQEIKEINTDTIPTKPPTENLPPAAVIVTPDQIQHIVIAKAPAEAPKTIFPDWTIAGKLGAMAPGFGIMADLYLLPVKIAENNALYTRAGLGYVSGARNGLVGQISEILFIKPENSTMGYYGGAGISLPFVSDGKLGYNLIVGAQNSVKLFNQKNEAIFAETGLGNFSSGNFNTNTINLLLGYKFDF